MQDVQEQVGNSLGYAGVAVSLLFGSWGCLDMHRTVRQYAIQGLQEGSTLIIRLPMPVAESERGKTQMHPSMPGMRMLACCSIQ